MRSSWTRRGVAGRRDGGMAGRTNRDGDAGVAEDVEGRPRHEARAEHKHAATGGQESMSAAVWDAPPWCPWWPWRP